MRYGRDVRWITIALGFVFTLTGCVGGVVTARHDLKMPKPITYDRAFGAAMQAAMDIGLSPKPSDFKVGITC